MAIAKGETAQKNFIATFKMFLESRRVEKELSGLPGNRNNIRVKTKLFTEAVEKGITEMEFADNCRDLGFGEDHISNLWNELEELKGRRLKAWMMQIMNTEKKTASEDILL